MNVRVMSMSLGIAAVLVAGVSSAGFAQELTGAGSSFAAPLYIRWASDYAARTKVRVNYQSIGSGGGIRQFSEMTVDFGGTDGPMTDEQMSKAKGGPVLHVPVAMGAAVIVYNVPGVTQQLRMSGPVIAGVFLGKIAKWNDAAIKALNPGVALPDQDILVVHRSDGSGTTFMFTDFLTAVSPEWAKAVGKGTDVKWAVGLGAKGSDGVTGQVKQLPGSIGYVELSYAIENKLQHALVRNAAGNFVQASIASVTAAAAAIARGLPANTDYRISIVNAPGKAAYPISSMTWALVYVHQSNPAKGKMLVDFLRYGITKGEEAAERLDYAPLPPTIVKQLEKRLDAIK